MNRWIAKWFGHFIAVIHALFFGTVIFSTIKLLQDDHAAYQMGMNPRMIIPMAILFCVLYILVMGVISTFVSINSYLAELVENQQAQKKDSVWVAGATSKGRIEPDL